MTMDKPLTIRVANEADAQQIRAIYAPHVESGVASFETDVPDVETMRARMRKLLPTHPWLVCVDGEYIAGYAYAGLHRERAAYRWSTEVTAYVHADYRGRGVGKRLYAALCTLLRTQGYVNAYAGITLPNEASVALHESCGFKPCALYRHTGHKFGTWYDVGWWQLVLQPPPPSPAEPIPFGALPATALSVATRSDSL
jgi:phosphinothricin acetyltransferase